MVDGYALIVLVVVLVLVVEMSSLTVLDPMLTP